jgi:hypothetical protein
MIIGVTGATGFIGRHFTKLAEAAGHTVVGFSRKPSGNQRDSSKMDFSGLDAVLHLAGENVFGLWSAAKKQRIHESRVDATKKMVAAMRSLSQPPKVLVSASGVAIYGDRGDEILDESSAFGSGYLGDVVKDWESSVAEANDFARTCSLRIGMVLGPDGGGWPMLKRIFKLALGGRLGSGRQWMPWIHVDDVARLMLFAIENSTLSGPVNGVAPESVTNLQFTKQLAAAVKRPAIFPVPGFLLKLLPGGMSCIFLDSMRVEPKKALAAGFQFKHRTLAGALEELKA